MKSYFLYLLYLCPQSEFSLYSACYHPHSCCFPKPDSPLVNIFISASTSDCSLSLSLCLSAFLSLQPKPPRSSENKQRPSSGACRHGPCKACWTLTTCAPEMNPRWQPWSTPSRRSPKINYKPHSRCDRPISANKKAAL